MYIYIYIYIMILSKYFQEVKLEEDSKILNDFKIKKQIHIKKTVKGNRTICQMLRNINLLTNYKHEYIIIILIKYINDAVLELRKYKNDFDKNWLNNKNSVNFNRSIFDPYYLSISKKILSINNQLFSKFFDLYNNIQHDNEKKLLLESLFYVYKINLKLYEYENLYKPLTEAGKNYTNQWNNILKIIIKINMQKYDPYKITYIELEKRLIKKPYFYKNGISTPLTNYLMFKEAFDYLHKPLLDILEVKKYDSIVELGSGFGRNIYYYASLLKYKYNFYMGEYTEGGISTANYIKNKYYNDHKIKINHFDYNNSSIFFEQLKFDKKHKSILFCTFWSIEQIINLKKEVINNILASADNVTCLHIEPVGWQISNKSIMKEDKIGFKKYYNKNLYKILKEFESEDKIKIDEVKLDFFNFGDPESCGTLIKWTKII